ncbi:unnamed protein product [Closterium sp. NIES-54]
MSTNNKAPLLLPTTTSSPPAVSSASTPSSSSSSSSAPSPSMVNSGGATPLGRRPSPILWPGCELYHDLRFMTARVC